MNGNKNKHRKNKYIFIQKHLASLFLCILQSSSLTSAHGDILINLLLCLDDTDRMPDGDLCSKTYRIYLPKNLHQKSILLNII